MLAGHEASCLLEEGSSCGLDGECPDLPRALLLLYYHLHDVRLSDTDGMGC